MLVVGLTGGIGSGKTTVAELFANRGVPIIDADLIAREVTQQGTPAFSSIFKHFGQEILLENGALDRAKLRKMIFNDENQRHWLENLLHPLIFDKIKAQIQTISAPYCIAVIPLLLEVQPNSLIQRILVIDTPEHIQIERVALRDKTEKSHVEAILKTQANRAHRLSQAHDVIINDGVLADLIPQVEKLHKMYLEMGKM